jgi:hypothetical protein
MAECADCRESYALWKKLAQLPEQVPPAHMRTRFENMLNAYEEGRWEHDKLKSQRREIVPKPFFGGWLSMPAMQLAAAAALLVIGIMIGRMQFPQQQPPTTDAKLAELTQELHSTKQLVALTLMQQTESASQRLQGVSYSMDMKRPDPEIVGALLHALRKDPSVDVRLAALDSLRRYNDDARVRKGLIDSLQTQKSPMVQASLIDTLVELKEKNALPTIQKLEQTPNLNPTVKQRAQQGIERLSRS